MWVATNVLMPGREAGKAGLDGTAVESREGCEHAKPARGWARQMLDGERLVLVGGQGHDADAVGTGDGG
jgi:hypothetical protein